MFSCNHGMHKFELLSIESDAVRETSVSWQETTIMSKSTKSLVFQTVSQKYFIPLLSDRS